MSASCFLTCECFAKLNENLSSDAQSSPTWRVLGRSGTYSLIMASHHAPHGACSLPRAFVDGPGFHPESTISPHFLRRDVRTHAPTCVLRPSRRCRNVLKRHRHHYVRSIILRRQPGLCGFGRNKNYPLEFNNSGVEYGQTNFVLSSEEQGSLWTARSEVRHVIHHLFRQIELDRLLPLLVGIDGTPVPVTVRTTLKKTHQWASQSEVTSLS